jgi:hypothetical protein
MSTMTGQMRQTKITFHFNCQKQLDLFQENILAMQIFFYWFKFYIHIFRHFNFITKYTFHYFYLRDNEFA